MFSRIWVKK